MSKEIQSFQFIFTGQQYMDNKVKQSMGSIDEQIKQDKDYMGNKVEQGMGCIEE